MSKTDPDHYKLPNGLEAYDVTKHFDFAVGSCLKYLWRAGRKGGETKLDDLRKVRWYLDKLIEQEEQENASEPNRETEVVVANVRLCPRGIACICDWKCPPSDPGEQQWTGEKEVGDE